MCIFRSAGEAGVDAVSVSELGYWSALTFTVLLVKGLVCAEPSHRTPQSLPESFQTLNGPGSSIMMYFPGMTGVYQLNLEERLATLRFTAIIFIQLYGVSFQSAYQVISKEKIWPRSGCPCKQMNRVFPLVSTPTSVFCQMITQEHNLTVQGPKGVFVFALFLFSKVTNSDRCNSYSRQG